MTMHLIAALDVDTILREEELLEKLQGTVEYYKVGLTLFTSHGKRAVDLVHRYGGKVFLDLKLLDIPQTVANTVREAQKLGAHSVSIHLSGGAEMVKAASAVIPRPKLWGVTVLTSLLDHDLKAFHPEATVKEAVLALARMGVRHSIDGLICSGQEVGMLREELGDRCPPFIVPGIRPAGHHPYDQKRPVTPAEAARLGIEFPVVGRPLIKAPDPLKAAQEILAEMKHAVSSAV